MITGPAILKNENSQNDIWSCYFEEWEIPEWYTSSTREWTDELVLVTLYKWPYYSASSLPCVKGRAWLLIEKATHGLALHYTRVNCCADCLFSNFCSCWRIRFIPFIFFCQYTPNRTEACVSLRLYLSTDFSNWNEYYFCKSNCGGVSTYALLFW
jgi:hypothetical protein